MNEQPTYTLPQDLLQAMVSALAAMPAAQSRTLLNAIEQTCAQQDQERAAKDKADALAAAKAQWAKEQKEAAEKAAAEAAKAAPAAPAPSAA